MLAVSLFAVSLLGSVLAQDRAFPGEGEARTCRAKNLCRGSDDHVKTTGCPTTPHCDATEAPKSSMLDFLEGSDGCCNVHDALVLTVASNETDGYKRYLRSVRVYGFDENLRVLGLDEPWKGGNMNYPGGGYKTNLFKKALKEYKDDKQKVVIFTDSYDVIFLRDLDAIVEKFKTFNARILFSAEEYCWPDKSLASKYPPVSRGKPYLNSGAFMGYASELYALLDTTTINDKDDDQLYYTKLYLDPELRSRHRIKLDHRSEIFQNLFGAIADVALEFNGKEAYLQNTVYDTVPMIVHGNGHSKLVLNSLGNYLAAAWNHEDGCLNCWDDSVELPRGKILAWPSVLVALFVDVPTPFLEEFFAKIHNQSYPKSRLHLFIYNNVPYHEKLVADFVANHGEEYKSVKLILPGDNIQVTAAKTLAMNHCLLKECSGYFSVDSVAHLDNEHALKLLVEQQRGIVAPLLVRPYETWSNFWGAIADNGFYARSSDYMEIIENRRRGLWNVPYITNCYLINATVIRNPAIRPSYVDGDLDPDMAFALSNRRNNVFMFVSNRLDFGHLVNADDFNTKFTNPDMFEIFNNKFDWQKRYIHENYTANFHPNNTPVQPCPDVYWFPIVSERFTRELVQLVETFGQWSDGSNNDPRIEGGYENVPTRDIHMKQVSYDRHWMYFLQQFVSPLQELVFTGYIHDDPRLETGYEAVPTRDIHMSQVGYDEEWVEFLKEYVNPMQELIYTGYRDYVRHGMIIISGGFGIHFPILSKYYDANRISSLERTTQRPPRSHMNFVVRYRPDEQPSLKPHHDASTYTINIALNKVGVDYEGGGCRFIRYNCSVTDTKPGWMLIHPGRLTHYHEGLLVTKGTRYIMISFVDP